MVLVVLSAACGDEPAPDAGSTGDATLDAGPAGGDAAPRDAEPTARDAAPGLDAEPAGDASLATDAGSGADAASAADAGADEDGTRFPIRPEVGVVLGDFAGTATAAFDGVVSQAAAASAQTEIYENLPSPPLLYKEFDCELRLRRVEVHPPTDGFLLHHPTNYPQGGTGTLTVVGRRADSSGWSPLATKPFGTSGSVLFLPEDLGSPSQYVAYGVRFSSDEPLLGTLYVAEISLFGYCASPTHTIAWSTTDWLCTGVECVAADNPGGIERRTVTCARDTGGYAHPSMCEGDEPPSEGASCSLSCGHQLVYVGARPFTYSNGSGWLHEGSVNSRAGPLPSSVEFGTTVESIAGQPCSIPTTNALAYFVGISCVEANDPQTLYCAFRCE